MKLSFLILVLIAFAIIGGFTPVFAEMIKQTMDGGMEVEITYPDTVVIGRDFPISILVKNNGWEDKEQISFEFSSNEIIVPIKKNEIKIEKITEGGSYGDTISFQIAKDASVGEHFLNLKYSQVLLENNEVPRKPTNTNIAIPLTVKDQAKVNIHTITPESIFAQAEFPFTIEILSDDIDLKDVRIEIIPPKDIEFRGETLHTFSSIQKSEPLSITSRIITPSDEIQTEYKVPFQIIVTYQDDVGEQKEDSKTVSLVLRPRTFMELTTDGGIWIGDFFIAPYVSLGTIIGIPAGALLSLLIRRKTQEPKKRKTKSKKK